ncbi:MAG TPA: ion transporter [Chitinophagaceae bacterium]|nr:ion transporter [Chitinophagaceae bacterium]
MYHTVKRKVYTLLHPELGNTKWDKAINAFIIVLILMNVIAVMLETVPSIYEPHKKFFHYFDIVSVIIFTIEYVLRVWSCNHDPKYKHSLNGRIRYMFSLGALIDLIAILPFYIYSVASFDLRVLRILRLLRFLRLFRLTSYMKATRLIVNVFKSAKNELLLSLVLTLFLIIISSCLVYFCEHLAQPDKFTSIPGTMWWSVVTLTTVGYGDMIPITTLGKVFTSTILLAGVALFALPAGIITANFLHEIRRLRNQGKGITCPHCGELVPESEHH